MRFFLIFLLSFLGFNSHGVGVYGAKILGIFLSPFKSHLLIHEAIARSVHEASHDLTIISSFPIQNQPVQNYRVIHVPWPESFDVSRMIQQTKRKFYNNFKPILNELIRQGNDSLHHPRIVQFLMDHQAGDFDLVIFGYFYNDFLLGLAEHFHCPIILSFMVQSVFTLDHIMAQPREVSYVPSIYSNLKQPLNFLGRLQNFYDFFMEEFVLLPWLHSTMDHYYRENFPLPQYGPLFEVYKNISLIFLNHHFTQGPIRPNQPGFIEIGGIQIPQESQPLPQDLENDLQTMTTKYNEIIYFNLGSMIESDHLDEEKAKIFIQVLTELSQDYKIIMKWNATRHSLLCSTKNIICRKWLPQTDILADKRIKIFITHGGQGAITEAQYFGVPIVGMPFFGDQHTNVERIVKFGYGLHVDYTILTAENFKQVIEEVLFNSTYRENIQKFSKLYRDRLVQPRQLVKYWVDYVLRYDGAKHIQSPAIHMNWWQLHSFDILGFLLSVSFLIIIFINFIIKYFYNYYLSVYWKVENANKRQSKAIEKRNKKNNLSKKLL